MTIARITPLTIAGVAQDLILDMDNIMPKLICKAGELEGVLSDHLVQSVRSGPGHLPFIPVPADLGKALMVRAGPAWTMGLCHRKADDVTGPWHVAQVINLSGGAARASGVQPALQIAGGAAGRWPVDRHVGVHSAGSLPGRPGQRDARRAEAPSRYTTTRPSSSTGGYMEPPHGLASRALIHMAASEDWTDIGAGRDDLLQDDPEGDQRCGSDVANSGYRHRSRRSSRSTSGHRRSRSRTSTVARST